jgi:hypothetical protein
MTVIIMVIANRGILLYLLCNISRRSSSLVTFTARCGLYIYIYYTRVRDRTFAYIHSYIIFEMLFENDNAKYHLMLARDARGGIGFDT